MRADASRPTAVPRAVDPSSDRDGSDAMDAVLLLPLQRTALGLLDADTRHARTGTRSSPGARGSQKPHDSHAVDGQDREGGGPDDVHGPDGPDDLEDLDDVDDLDDLDGDDAHDDAADPEAEPVRGVVAVLVAAQTVAALAALAHRTSALAALALVLLVGVAHPFLVPARLRVRLVLGGVAAVAVPPLLRVLWVAAGVPGVLVEALAHGRYVPPAGTVSGIELSPLPWLTGPAGLAAAVLAALVTPLLTVGIAAARSSRRAAPSGGSPARADAMVGHATDLEPPAAGPDRHLSPGRPTVIRPTVRRRLPARATRLGRIVRQAIAFRLPFAARRSIASRLALPARRPLREPRLLRLPRLPETWTPGDAAAARLARRAAPGMTPPAITEPDRAALLRRIGEALSDRDVNGGEVGVLAIAPDRLESLSAALGRDAASDIVRQAVRRLRAWLPPADLVACIDSATVGVVVEGLGPDSTDGLARRLSALLGEPMSVATQTLPVPFSIGIATSGAAASTPPDLLRSALDALDTAPATGVRWAHFDPARRSALLAEGMLELDLHRALRERAIRAAFQPIVRLGATRADDRTVGMEVLARWTRHGGQHVPPSRFVPLAERLGLGPVLGLQVLECALDAAASWYPQGHAVGRLALNVAQSQLDDPHFPDDVVTQLDRRELPAACLVVELPATSFTPTRTAVDVLDRLVALGVEVMLDDFGLPGSSLLAVRSLPLAGVKLDTSVTADLTKDPEALAATVAYCHGLGLRCLAEGVETEAQLEQVRAAGVDAVQGFALGRPARARDVTAAFRCVHTNL